MTEPAVPHGTTGTLPPPSANGSGPAARRQHSTQARRLPTRISGMRTGLIAGILALIVVLIFIIQNAHAVNISFLGVHLLLSLAVALLLAAIAGALVMVAAGTAADHPASADDATQPAQRPYRLSSRDDRSPGAQIEAALARETSSTRAQDDRTTLPGLRWLCTASHAGE